MNETLHVLPPPFYERSARVPAEVAYASTGGLHNPAARIYAQTQHTSNSIPDAQFSSRAYLNGSEQMFNEETDSLLRVQEGRVFVHQTSAALYASPSSDAEVIARIAQGAAVDVRAGEQAEAQAGWLCVQVPDGQSGFVRANTQLTTREQLLVERAAIQRSSKIGWGQMLMGGSICLCGIVATVGTYLLSEKYNATTTIYIFLWRGDCRRRAVLVGIGADSQQQAHAQAV